MSKTLCIFSLIFFISLTTIVTNKTEGYEDVYEIPVLVLAYYPDENNDGLLDPEIVGGDAGGRPVDEIKTKVVNMTNSLVETLEYGSTYHGYKDPKARPSLNYTIMDAQSFDEAIPVSKEFPPFADHLKLLNDLNICDYVENQRVKEVWIWMYHSAVVVPIESNMSGPYGDISNSYRQDDLPHCAGTYTVYDYNYGRGVSETTENHMHQIEAVLNYVDGRDITPHNQWNTLLFWGNFVGSDASHKIVKPGCGWAHYPPNGINDYDWGNREYAESDCEDWRPDGTGEVQVFNCDKWNCDSLTFFKWWMQNVPGSGNDLYYEGRKLKNWWSFFGDFDFAMEKGKSLYWDVGPIRWDLNGHYYEVINEKISWNEAKAAAESLTYLGYRGHLVTITSAEENLWLTETFGADALHNHYIGGYQLPGTPEPDGGWSWVTDEQWVFKNWWPSEPNDLGGEDVVVFDHGVTSKGKSWNDSNSTVIREGYVVEYEPPLENINSLVTFDPIPSSYSFTLDINGILFQDDFNDGNNFGWTTTIGEWDATSGYNEATGLYNGRWAYTYAGNASWDNYTLDVDITFGAGNTEFIVAVRVDPSSSPELVGGRQYYLSVDGDNNVIRLRYTIEPSGFFDLQTVPYNLLDEETYHIRISIFGNNLIASIDGNPIFDYTFSGTTPIYSNGTIGIGYQSDDGPDGAYFDNVLVEAPGCSSSFAGKFTFDATLTNISEKELSNLFIEVDELTNDNLLLTDNGLIGEGGRFDILNSDDYADGVLSHEEYVDVPFTVCLKNTKPFRFFVNVLGVAAD